MWLVEALAPGRHASAWASTAVPPVGLVAAAQIHGVEGWVHRRATESGHHFAGLDLAVHAARARHLRAVADLVAAAGTLREAAVPFLVVKGPALVTAYYGGPGLRSYVDLDLLVAPSRLLEAVQGLERAGFQLLDVNWPLLQRMQVHELSFQTPSGGVLDLHWALSGAERAGSRSPSFSALLSRSEHLQLGGSGMQTLGLADTIAHLAVHAAQSGGHRLLWLADLRQALARVAEQGLVGGPIAEVVDEWRARPSLDLMLRRLDRCLDVRTDPGLTSFVDCGLWSRFAAAGERFSPPERSGDLGSLSRLVARSSRASGPVSALAFARKSVQWAFDRHAGRPVAARASHDPTDPNSARFSHGGQEAAYQFFEWVAGR